MSDSNLNAATKSFDPDIVLKSVHPKYRAKLQELWNNIKPNLNAEDFIPPRRQEGQSEQDYADMIENYMNTYNEGASVRPSASQSVWATDQSSGSNVQASSPSREEEKKKPRSSWTDDYFSENPPQGENEDVPQADYGLDAASVSDWSESEINSVYQKMVDEGKIKPDYLAVTTQKRQKILGVLGGAR